MHSNVHFAMGVIIASAAQYFFPTNTIMDSIYFLIIILSAIIADLDIFASKFARDNDHRNFFTHSIYPSVLILVIGVPVAILWGIHVVWFSAIGYASHLFLDTLDWKVRLFYGKKQYGFAFLLTEDEQIFKKTRTQLQLESGMDSTSFSIYRYFHNTGMLTTGITIAILSFLLLFVIAPRYWYVFLGYFGLLEIYMYQKKKMESKHEEKDDL